MRQVVRFMDMPDKVIAFEGLPEELLNEFEMLNCSKLPRHWRDFIGTRERIVKIKPERDPYTGKMSENTIVKETAPFCWVVDREINKDKEAWRVVESYVKRNAPKDFRLTDPIVEIETGKSTMAKPMANDANSELSLEPEDVVIIPLDGTVSKDNSSGTTVSVIEKAPMVDIKVTKNEMSRYISQVDRKCESCGKIFINAKGLEVHIKRMHRPDKVEVPSVTN